MRQKIVAGNWKMNTSIAQGKELVHGILDRMAEVPRGVKLIVAPPFTHLYPAAMILEGGAVGLAAQNCADHESGAYTGEVSAAMIELIPCQYVILGHSERR
ncbi:MAG: triose-phosphate isomerase, partial [Bacteroidales bacterium]